MALPVGVRFSKSNAPAAARNSHRLRPGHVLRQLIDIRDILHKRLLADDLKGSDAAQIARAHKDVVQQIMDFQGQGKPRPVQAKNDPATKQSRRAATPAEPHLPD